jgi:hypothetical protein
MKNGNLMRVLVAGMVVFFLLSAPALALTEDEILSKYRSPSGSTFVSRNIYEILPHHDCPDCGEPIEFIMDDEPSGEGGSYICPPDTPFGPLHHCRCTFIGLVNMDTGKVVDSECEPGDPPMGIDDAGRIFIVKEDCPCIWADDETSYHGIPIPPRSSYDTSDPASRIKDTLNRFEDISHSDEEITTPVVLFEPLVVYAIQNNLLYPPEAGLYPSVEKLWISTAATQDDIGQIIRGLKDNKPQIPNISG